MIENTAIDDRLTLVPAEYRQTVATALATAFGPESLPSLSPLRGGASGALLYQADIVNRHYVVRVETRLGSPFRIPHQYVCMQRASDAGIAPPLRFLDADGNVIARVGAEVQAGHSTLLDYTPPAVPINTVGDVVNPLRAEIRASVNFLDDQVPPDPCRVNVEIFDNATGRTTVLYAPPCRGAACRAGQ